MAVLKLRGAALTFSFVDVTLKELHRVEMVTDESPRYIATGEYVFVYEEDGTKWGGIVTMVTHSLELGSGQLSQQSEYQVQTE